ncbi:M56 family metallopeptidase [Sulfitobacter aestuariivivens]|uniref:M56 family metallopeptidase n=1 Tax=Sulfitobacter aestuariivivens TaxID=2766981 RepID=UPI003610D597
MIAGEALLDAFINANILFLLGYALWFGVRAAMTGLGLGHAYGTQLKLLNAVFVAILCAPFVALAFAVLQGTGMTRGVNVNLSDMVVSYYLNGGFEMNSSQFEGLVLARDTFLLDLLNGQGAVAQTFIALFLVGFCVGVLRLAYSVFCLWRIVSSGYSWRRIGRIRIRVSDRTLVPFSTRGWRNYYVVLPSQSLGRYEELQVALAHEFQHIRQGDLEWEVLMEALKPFFFFNPAYRGWKRRVEHLRELNCDSAVLSLGRIQIRAYCDSLLSVCQRTLRRDRAMVLAVPKVTLVTADRTSLFGRNGGFWHSAFSRFLKRAARRISA